MYNANDLFRSKMVEMHGKMQGYEQAIAGGFKPPISKKSYTGYVRTLPFLAAFEGATLIQPVLVDVRKNDNIGVLVEATVKALLNKGNAKSLQGETDLVTGGRRFELKVVIKGSSSYASSLDLTSNEDVLIISNLGAYILRNENIMQAVNQGYFKKGEDKLKPTILNSDLLTQTNFTNRLNEEWEINTWS